MRKHLNQQNVHQFITIESQLLFVVLDPAVIRRVGFSFFGIFPATELNPEFLETALDALPKGKELILVCETGGSLESKVKPRL